MTLFDVYMVVAGTMILVVLNTYILLCIVFYLKHTRKVSDGIDAGAKTSPETKASSV